MIVQAIHRASHPLGAKSGAVLTEGTGQSIDRKHGFLKALYMITTKSKSTSETVNSGSLFEDHSALLLS